MPSALATMAVSILSAASCECGRTGVPEPGEPARGVFAMLVVVALFVVVVILLVVVLEGLVVACRAGHTQAARMPDDAGEGAT